jgi:uncharacterized protein (DUF2344 family)
METEFKIGETVMIKGDGYFRKIIGIRNGEALTIGADDKTGYIKLEILEKVSDEEIMQYINHALTGD